MDNVIVVGFDEDSNAYTALTGLKELDQQGQLKLAEAGVVVRGDDGRVVVKDTVTDYRSSATVTGGLIGLLVGFLAGPFGILLGGVTGLFIGSLYDEKDHDQTQSVLIDIASSLTVGRLTLLARVDEQSPEVVDTAMTRLGGTVLRHPIADVEAEMASAEDAQKEAKKAARRHLFEQRQHQHADKVHAAVEELKAKLHRHGAGAAGG